MIRIQLPGGTAPPPNERQAAATVRGGILVMADQREDIERLLALMDIVRKRDSWAPPPAEAEPNAELRVSRDFAVLYGYLLAGWLGEMEALRPPPGFRVEAAERSFEVEDSFEALRIGLAVAHGFWNEDDPLFLRLAIACPSNGSGQEVGIDLSQSEAALWLAPGSLLADIAVGASVKATRWCASLASPFVTTGAEVASRNLIEKLRARAQAKAAYPIPRLDELSDGERDEIAKRPVLVVLLHGLCSTDLGTFDGFIRRLRQASPSKLDDSLNEIVSRGTADGSIGSRSGLHGLVERLNSFRKTCPRAWDAHENPVDYFTEKNIAIVGWPHDSLASIDTCASKLRELLERDFGSGDSPRHVVFVCHSQGGLLARATCIKLANANSPAARWMSRIAGIATFGTPHNGAILAETGFDGGREFAAYLLMLRNTGSPTSLIDVLALLKEREVGGVNDLKSYGASSKTSSNSYVRQLSDLEAGLSWPNGEHTPELLTVGGELSASDADQWKRRLAHALISKKLQQRSHDLVVETSSSTGRDLRRHLGLRIESDHFSYFQEEGASRAGLDMAIAYLWTLLIEEVKAWEREIEKGRAQALIGLANKLKPTKPITLVKPGKSK